jgi:hypothetical protein
MPRSIAATSIVALPLAYLFASSGAVSALVAIVSLASFCFVVLSAGLMLLHAAKCAHMPAAAAWVLGIVATAVAVYALATLFALLAAAAFAVWALAVLLAAALMRHRQPAIAPLPWADVLGLTLCAGATLWWCRELAEVPALLAREGVLATWTDQFIHGAAISQFGDARAAGRQSIELADVAAPPYHYATYLLPAAFAAPLDVPGLTLATSVWVPLGFLTMCAGAYVLGVSLAGVPGGVAALVAVTLLPDAASYGLHNRLFGYYWYVLAVPGASYAVGAALLAIAFVKQGHSAAGRRAFAAGACLVAATLALRVHIFMVAAPAWIAAATLAAGLLGRRKLLAFGLALAGFAFAVWAFYRVFPDVPHALARFLDVTHNEQQPVAYRGLYKGLEYLYGPEVAVPVGVILVFAALLGVFLLLYPLSVLLVRRARPLDAVDAVPVILLAVYLLLILTAPVPPHGDATEFTQRPFVLVYAVVAVWTAAGFAAWASAHGGLGAPRVRLAVLGCAGLTIVWALNYTVRDWRWSYSYRVAEGLPEAAIFVRHNARDGDVLAAQGMQPGLVTTDPAVQLVSLTGVPAYLTRPFMHISAGGRRAEAAVERYNALRAVERAESAADALGMLRRLGIRWYLVANRDRSGPGWDPHRARAAFADRMVAVYSTH